MTLTAVFSVLLACLSILAATTSHAQAPAMEWHRGHGTDHEDHVHYGLQTSDGGYVVFSDTDTAGSKQPNNFGVMKLVPDSPAE